MITVRYSNAPTYLLTDGPGFRKFQQNEYHNYQAIQSADRYGHTDRQTDRETPTIA